MQQHGSKYLRAYTLDPGVGSTFSEYGHVAYQIKANHEMQQLVSKYFACRPPLPDPGNGVTRSKFNFFRTWSCNNQIKESHKCSIMVANILPIDPLPPPPKPYGLCQ